MFFILEKELFKDSNKESLMLILYSGLHNKAFLQFDDEDNEIREWQKNNDLISWDGVFRCFLSDATRFKAVNKVVVRDSIKESNWSNEEYPIITLKDACNLIGMSYELWLENKRNDGAFIRCVLKKEIRGLFDSLVGCGQLRLDGLGGIGEMKVVLREDPTRFGFRNKIFVVCDSDASLPNEPHSNAEEIVEICEQHKIFHHCLERRSIENYVPIALLAEKMHPLEFENSSLGKKYQAFIELTKNQQYYFHMKTGLKNDDCIQSGLYDNLTEESSELLQCGFGNDLADKFRSIDIEEMHQHIHHNGGDELEFINSKINDYMRVPV